MILVARLGAFQTWVRRPATVASVELAETIGVGLRAPSPGFETRRPDRCPRERGQRGGGGGRESNPPDRGTRSLRC